MSDLKNERDALRDAVVNWSIEAAELKREVERLEARVADLEAELTGTAASLAAAISLLERGGKAAKKAAASDKMFDIMLNDYREALEGARAALAAEGKGNTPCT